MLFKQIQYFLGVATCRHFTRAAEKLFVSQSALSQQITKLESDLGLKLINRDTHPIELTPAGQDFLLCAEKIVRDIEMLHKQLQKHLPIEKRTIQFGMITGVGNTDIAGLLTAFTVKYPDIHFTITTDLSKELCRMLRDGVIDLALFAAPYDIGDYNFEVLDLEKEEFVLIAPEKHPLAQKSCVALADTCEERYIFPTPENVSHDIFLAECQKAGFSPNIISECNGPGRRIDLVKGGLGISLISTSGLRYHNNDGLAIVRLKTPFYKQMILARSKQEPASPVVLAFWNHMRHL